MHASNPNPLGPSLERLLENAHSAVDPDDFQGFTNVHTMC